MSNKDFDLEQLNTNDKNASSIILSFDNLSVFVKEKRILKNISLTIPKTTEIIVIAGASGCGKTTLLNIINNYDLPNPYVVSGKLDYHKSNIKMIGHNPIFNPYLTVKEIIQMFITSYGCEVDVEYYLEKFNLTDIKDKFIGDDQHKSLSTGQLVQLSILLNTIEVPDLLILDEPLSNLDIKSSINIMKILKELNIPIILTLHHPNNIILNYVDHLIIIESGKITLNVQLNNINNRLEYYETHILTNHVNVENLIENLEIKNLEIVNYHSYLSKISFLNKTYNSFYNILMYFWRNRGYKMACFFSFIPTIIIYILINNTNYKDPKNGYLCLINNSGFLIMSFYLPIMIHLFELNNTFKFVRYYNSINIINEKIYYVIYSITSFYLMFLCVLFNSLCFSYLNPNNLVMLSTLIKVTTLTKFIDSLIIYSLFFLTDQTNVTNSIYMFHVIFQIFNSGLQSINYKELKNYSIYYNAFNLISVAAQEEYNYKKLPNGDMIYTTYGYDRDVSNCYYYILGYLLVPIFIYCFYKKRKTIFLT
jgi:ABC-type multidrug transport system ATPase subunit